MSEKTIVKAKISFVRQTARKMRRVINLVRGKTAGEAAQALEFMSYAAAEPVLKLVKSAMANAAHNNNIEKPEDLVISQILADDKMTFKRFQAVSKGRAHSILKRSCSVSIVLSEMTNAEYAAHVWDVSPRNKKNQKNNEVKA